ncbi:MAG: translocation/assembly module TamB domain-containing protein, partial [Calditrichaeota bacterium]|nr:translocation/assembly module TamB domain-containing protein [Calditrichota bacterium]MCB0316448.1 translocation/assembly module TamB domain-containing protein [Calditrichota bacterium]
SAISEGDAISYLIFGRSMNELTQGQRSGLAAGGGNSGIEKAGLSAGLGMVSAKLSRFLGNKFNLDYVEIKGEDNWQSATFVAGKYITNDLFMSYEKSFGRTQSEDIASEVITLEYELTRFLFLQLIQGDPKASGAEIIFKFERE